MKLSKTFGRVATTLVATAMLASLAVMPASAEALNTDPGKVGTVDVPTGISSVSFNKTLTVPENVPVPNVTFTFTMQGVAPNEGGETVSDADQNEIAVSDGTNTIPENAAAENARVITDTAEFTTMPADDEEQTVTTAVTFSLNGMTFPEPGVYKYTVTEAEQSGYSTADPLTLYLYVENVSGSSKVTGAVLKDSKGKTATVENTYLSNGTLTVTKHVEGNMANNSETFDFTITVTGAQDRPISAVPTGNGELTTAPTWDKTNGCWTVEVKLGDKDTVVIYGLSANDTYTVDEPYADTDSYVTSIVAPGSTIVSGDGSATEDVADVTGTYINSNRSVTYTNTRNSVTPTGIVMDIAPYALLVVVAAGACFFFMRKRRED